MKSEHTLEATVDITTKDGIESQVTIKGILCTWNHEEMTREAAELWTVIDYVSDNFTFETFSVVSFSGSKAIS